MVETLIIIKEDDVMSWWHTIRPTDGLNRYAGERAELRRCHDTAEVLFLPGFHLLLEKTGLGSVNLDLNREYVREQMQILATLAWVLSWVKSESEKKFAETLAQSDPKFQPVRFRRLLECSSYDDLGIQLIRALKFTKQQANVSDLIHSILYWNHNAYVKENWAISYYGIANKKDNKGVE